VRRAAGGAGSRESESSATAGALRFGSGHGAGGRGRAATAAWKNQARRHGAATGAAHQRQRPLRQALQRGAQHAHVGPQLPRGVQAARGGAGGRGVARNVMHVCTCIHIHAMHTCNHIMLWRGVACSGSAARQRAERTCVVESRCWRCVMGGRGGQAGRGGAPPQWRQRGLKRHLQCAGGLVGGRAPRVLRTWAQAACAETFSDDCRSLQLAGMHDGRGPGADFHVEVCDLMLLRAGNQAARCGGSAPCSSLRGPVLPA
jgi:hypothetical protein